MALAHPHVRNSKTKSLTRWDTQPAWLLVRLSQPLSPQNARIPTSAGCRSTTLTSALRASPPPTKSRTPRAPRRTASRSVRCLCLAFPYPPSETLLLLHVLITSPAHPPPSLFSGSSLPPHALRQPMRRAQAVVSLAINPCAESRSSPYGSMMLACPPVYLLCVNTDWMIYFFFLFFSASNRCRFPNVIHPDKEHLLNSRTPLAACPIGGKKKGVNHGVREHGGRRMYATTVCLLSCCRLTGPISKSLTSVLHPVSQCRAVFKFPRDCRTTYAPHIKVTKCRYLIPAPGPFEYCSSR